jgi:predicted nuclease of restriction endonuclease-like (RecB) superfamily
MIRFPHSWCGATQVTTAKQNQSTPVAPREKQFLPQAVAEIPWGHNVTLLEKLKDSAQRTWYARQATANGWSRSMLDHRIESDLYSRQGKAVTNFKQALPPPQSDLASCVEGLVELGTAPPRAGAAREK